MGGDSISGDVGIALEAVGTALFVQEVDDHMKRQWNEALFFIDQLLVMIGPEVKRCEIIRKEGLYVPDADLLLDYETMRQNAQDFLNKHTQ